VHNVEVGSPRVQNNKKKTIVGVGPGPNTTASAQNGMGLDGSTVGREN
jgi:hypothetical protein